MCIAILNDKLVRISIKFRPQVPVDGTVDMNGPAGSDGVRTAVCEDHENVDSDVSGSVDKQCTLTPLAVMSSPRCGLGVTVLNGQLIAVGKLLQSPVIM